MSVEHPFIRIPDLVPENMDEGEGWSISEFRIVIDGTAGVLLHDVPRDLSGRVPFTRSTVTTTATSSTTS